MLLHPFLKLDDLSMATHALSSSGRMKAMGSTWRFLWGKCGNYIWATVQGLDCSLKRGRQGRTHHIVVRTSSLAISERSGLLKSAGFNLYSLPGLGSGFPKDCFLLYKTVWPLRTFSEWMASNKGAFPSVASKGALKKGGCSSSLTPGL